MNNTEVILSKVLAESHYVHNIIQNKEKKEENSSVEGSKK